MGLPIAPAPAAGAAGCHPALIPASQVAVGGGGSDGRKRTLQGPPGGVTRRRQFGDITEKMQMQKNVTSGAVAQPSPAQKPTSAPYY
ncbi:hypothetical protein O9K51_05445 [Purpureocillium lavendulum]|uniref:Uncharacterized protein n=1 Tax=Purpureocillium lavendulum TaxID=1247861 RepID=A0AB34FR79_9HYPO|nr:hypothetical protein O9K51_05445 [Purpureocillium lavendulum]